MVDNNVFILYGCILKTKVTVWQWIKIPSLYSLNDRLFQNAYSIKFGPMVTVDVVMWHKMAEIANLP